MKEIWDKLSSYQVFSSSIPGGATLALLSRLNSEVSQDSDWAELTILSYVLGLAFNRVGAFLLRGIPAKDIALMYKIYRDNPLDQGVYDAFAMYRTLTIAMLFVSVMCWHIEISKDASFGPLAASIAAAVAALIFGAAWLVQKEYVMRLLDHHRPPAPEDRSLSSGGPRTL